MTDAETRAIETRIDFTLFDRSYWASPRWREATRCKLIAVSRAKEDVPEDRVEITPAEAATCGDIWEHRRFCSDLRLVPMLLNACDKRGWEVIVSYGPWGTNPWRVHLTFGQRFVRISSSLPEALCLAIIAVLDAIEEEA